VDKPSELLFEMDSDFVTHSLIESRASLHDARVDYRPYLPDILNGKTYPIPCRMITIHYLLCCDRAV
jgi:hypothetical protein